IELVLGATRLAPGPPRFPTDGLRLKARQFESWNTGAYREDSSGERLRQQAVGVERIPGRRDVKGPAISVAEATGSRLRHRQSHEAIELAIGTDPRDGARAPAGIPQVAVLVHRSAVRYPEAG